MAKNSTKSRGYSRKRKIVVVVAVLISAALIGATLLPGFYSIFSGAPPIPAQQSPTAGLETQVQTLVDQVKANPDNLPLKQSLANSYFQLAMAYNQAQDSRAQETFAKTIQTYNEVVNKDPKNKENLGDMATAYFYSGQVDQAIETAQKALEIDPNFAPVLFNMGIYLGDGKMDYINAIKQLQKVPKDTEQYSYAQDLIKTYTDYMANPPAPVELPTNK